MIQNCESLQKANLLRLVNCLHDLASLLSLQLDIRNNDNLDPEFVEAAKLRLKQKVQACEIMM